MAVSTTSSKPRRMVTALGFLSGILACLDAVRDAKVLWPPDAVWAALRHPQRLEFGGGMALVVVSLVTAIVQARRRLED
ncbi:MAG TPA: hypothetical protein VGS05_13675 [Candidatus Sulfotelmatobacter sp.]|nr:hypothetical protein [Candidatus Sulfotelmatobacter sp.]